jgi:hypothetical protein
LGIHAVAGVLFAPLLTNISNKRHKNYHLLSLMSINTRFTGKIVTFAKAPNLQAKQIGRKACKIDWQFTHG